MPAVNISHPSYPLLFCGFSSAEENRNGVCMGLWAKALLLCLWVLLSLQRLWLITRAKPRLSSWRHVASELLLASVFPPAWCGYFLACPPLARVRGWGWLYYSRKANTLNACGFYSAVFCFLLPAVAPLLTEHFLKSWNILPLQTKCETSVSFLENLHLVDVTHWHTQRWEFWTGTLLKNMVWSKSDPLVGFIKRPSPQWIETPSSAPGSLQPGLLWGHPSLPSCPPASTCQQPEGRVKQGLINPEIWNFKKMLMCF